VEHRIYSHTEHTPIVLRLFRDHGILSGPGTPAAPGPPAASLGLALLQCRAGPLPVALRRISESPAGRGRRSINLNLVAS